MLWRRDDVDDEDGVVGVVADDDDGGYANNASKQSLESHSVKLLPQISIDSRLGNDVETVLARVWSAVGENDEVAKLSVVSLDQTACFVAIFEVVDEVVEVAASLFPSLPLPKSPLIILESNQNPFSCNSSN